MERKDINGVIDTEYLRKYYENKGYADWDTADLLWMSTTQPVAHVMTDAYIPNSSDGYYTNKEIEILGSEVEWTGSPLPDLSLLPYPSRMRPLRDMTFLKTAKNIIFVNIQFVAYDAKVNGSSVQSAAVNSALSDSISSSVNNAYAQTRTIRSVPVTWIDNHFNPIFKVNDFNIFKSLEHSGFNLNTSLFGPGVNKGDLSIGQPLPYETNVFKHFQDGINTIDVSAFVAQRIVIASTGAIWFKRYPLVCRAFVTYLKN